MVFRATSTPKGHEGGGVAQLVERRTGTPLSQVPCPGAAKDFSPRVNFQCGLSDGVRTPPCSIAGINICVHVKNPLVHVSVRWIMESLKHPECTVGWQRDSVAAGFPQRKQPKFAMGEITMGQHSYEIKKKSES